LKPSRQDGSSGNPLGDSCVREQNRSRRWAFWLGLALIVGLAAALRLPDLADKPLHSDEGVNGWFTLRLYWWNLYQYRPTDYHGPFLFYVNLLCFHLLGPGEVALRLGTAIAGMLLPLTVLPLRRHLGALGALCLALLIACSPAMVYFSRTNIHETYLVLGTMLWLAGAVRCAARPSMGWALLASGGASLAFVNKETALLTAAALGFGFLLAWSVGRRRPGDFRLDDPDLYAGMDRKGALRLYLGSWRLLLTGVLVFVAVLVTFFSSLFTWWPGVAGFFEAFGHWVGYGVSGRNQDKDWDYFIELLLATDGVFVFALCAASGLWALGTRHRFGLLLFGWFLASLLTYSALPYKTPWCVLNVELPMLALVAWSARQLWFSAQDFGQSPTARIVALLALALVFVAAVPMYQQSAEVNRQGYDDDDYGYVFVQTQRGYYEFLQDLFGIGDQSFALEGRRPRMVNIDPKNPTRWYTITRGWNYERRDYLNGRLPKLSRLKGAEVVLSTGQHARQVGRLLSQDTTEQWHGERYSLRPGVQLYAWYRSRYWDAYQRAGGRQVSPWPRPPQDTIYKPPLPKKYRK